MIGSGATAVTLVPALAGTAGHVTMLQRSPSYVVSPTGPGPAGDADWRSCRARCAYPVVRWANILLGIVTF